MLLRVIGVIAGIAALVATGLGIRLATLDTYTNTLPPQLQFELRVPTGLAGPRDAVAIELDTDKNVANALIGDDWRDEGATRVLTGLVSLDFKTTSRLLVVSLPDQPKRLFRLRLDRDPDATPALSEWQPPDFTDVPGEEKRASQPRRSVRASLPRRTPRRVGTADTTITTAMTASECSGGLYARHPWRAGPEFGSERSALEVAGVKPAATFPMREPARRASVGPARHPTARSASAGAPRCRRCSRGSAA